MNRTTVGQSSTQRPAPRSRNPAGAAPARTPAHPLRRTPVPHRLNHDDPAPGRSPAGALDVDAAARAGEHASAAATSAGLAAGAALSVLGSATGLAVERATEAGHELARVLRDGADRLPTPPALERALEGVLEEALDRGTEVWDAVRGYRRPQRRWTWAVGSAAAGAAVAVAVTVLVRRLRTQDAPGAQEPEQVRAVVDPAPTVPAAAASAAVPAGAAVDEDGEVVEPA